MSMLDELAANGADIQEGLNRLMNNEAIYEKLLKKLPDSIAQQNVVSYFESGDIENAIKSAHTIKGVTGNLSITPLYQAYTEIVTLLRAGKVQEARTLYDNTMPLQEKFIGIIESN